MGFDLDRFRAAHEPWSVRCNGRTYRARWLSADEVMQYRALWAEAPARRSGQPEERWQHEVVVHRQEVMAAALRLLRRLFPWRPSMWLWGDPVAVFRRATEVEQQVWLRDFFASRAATIAALKE